MPIEAIIEDQPVEATEIEEVTEEVAPVETPEEATEEIAQPSVEDIAKDLGWKPQDEFQGNDETYVDPATYIRKSKDIQQSMSQHLKDNRRKMDQMERGISDLHNHYEQVSKTQIAKQQREIERLRKDKREAIEEGDADKVDQIESEMLDKYSSMESAKKQPQAPAPDPEHVDAFNSWLSQNNWYKAGVDPEMVAYADRLADSVEYDALPYQKKLSAVTDMVKKAFPEKFRTQHTPTSNSVEAPRGTTGKKQFSKRDLSSDQQAIMGNFVKRGIMTEKQYIADLAEIGEIG